jgi:hypothetical protein
MKGIATALALMLLLFAVALQAQTPASKPGPEHKKLEIWVGDWTYEGETKATPLGPADKYTAKMTVRPILNGFFVEFRGEEKGAKETTQWAEIDGYDPVANKYVWHGFTSSGGTSTVAYTIEGTTVPYSGTQIAGGKQYKIRGTCIFTPDFMTWIEKREVSVDGTSWIPLSESKFTKIKPSPKK